MDKRIEYNKGKGGKNRRRGKNDNEENKRELEFKEDGQGRVFFVFALQHVCVRGAYVVFFIAVRL